MYFIRTIAKLISPYFRFDMEFGQSVSMSNYTMCRKRKALACVMDGFMHDAAMLIASIVNIVICLSNDEK